jgi:hypothetical protein
MICKAIRSKDRNLATRWNNVAYDLEHVPQRLRRICGHKHLTQQPKGTVAPLAAHCNIG